MPASCNISRSYEEGTMGEPRPVLGLVALQGLAILVLAGWWLLRPPTVRLVMLARVQQVEQVRGPVPLAVQDQAEWLIRHRSGRLQGVTGVGVLALVIGIAEGVARRKRDIYGGFLYKSWVIGSLALPIAIGVAVSYLLLPWPLSLGWYRVGLSGVIGGMGYFLASGRPYIL
jgi:hypothetical protein